MNTTRSNEKLLDVRGLTVEIDGRNGPAVVVDGIDLHVNKGETLGVVGESGCGKSLTMLSLMRLLPNKIKVTKGSASFDGHDLQKMSNKELRKVRGGDIGFVFQDPMTSLNPVMRIGDQICEPLIYHRGMKKADARVRAVELLRLVGIPGPEERLQAYPHELSGGMRQRVMIAIGLACNPKLLIADEPTTALDVTIQAQIVDLVKDLRAKLGMSVVWITHAMKGAGADLGEAALAGRLARRQLLGRRGRADQWNRFSGLARHARRPLLLHPARDADGGLLHEP